MILTKEFLFGSIFLLSNKLQALGDGYLKEITLKQWLLLIMIQTIDKERPSVTEVAVFMGSTRQNIRKMLEALEKKGYVILSQNEKDKRNLSVALTSQTQHFFEQFEAQGDALLEQLFQNISPEQLATTRQTFDTLFENIERMEEAHV
ncbi:MarR family winged helix-turn-helix transcriptional regulator [Pygmaiobacter massiliensis]|uniref:MarR family winged helix-turn-helix transcriptional regulator n=1 Tax=Pygmaiobacter massiliensis TaxID=1917873 RepID=UPI000C7A3922|nr:MarR family transcriptional regulator [Pygmaiobacter massiliensis]